jgi:hypothetical protein
MIDILKRRFGLLGRNISYSFSKGYFTEKFNDEVFLGNKKDFESAKTNATLHIYFYFSLIPLLIILLILKKKSQ